MSTETLVEPDPIPKNDKIRPAYVTLLRTFYVITCSSHFSKHISILHKKYSYRILYRYYYYKSKRNQNMKSITAFAPSKTSGVSSIHMAAGSLSKPAVFAGQSTTSVSALPGWFASHSASCSCANCAAHTAGCQCASCGVHSAGCLCSSCSIGHSFGCHCSACVTAFVQ